MGENGQRDETPNQHEPLRALVKDLHTKIDQQTKVQQEHNKITDRLFIVVLGDEGAMIDGLAKRVKSQGKYISIDKKLKIAATALATSGAGTWWGWDFLKSIFIK